MALTVFDPENKFHQDALYYFLHSAGHPMCKLEDEIDEIDMLFRIIAVEEFNLDPWIYDDPNGSFIVVVNDDPKNLELIICLEYFDENERHREVFLKGAGEVLMDKKHVLWNIDIRSLDLSTEAEFNRYQNGK